MISRDRRPETGSTADRTSAELLLDSETMSLDEFWDAMADEVEAMSNEELRAELAPLKARLARKVH